MAWIKRIYLYLVSLIALIIIIIGAQSLIDIGLKTWVFTKADNDFYNPRVVCPLTVGGERSIECDEKELTEEDLQDQKNRQ